MNEYEAVRKKSMDTIYSESFPAQTPLTKNNWEICNRIVPPFIQMELV